MEELAWELLGDTRINTADTSQRRLTQAVVTAYPIVTAALMILAPTLMLNLISIAHFFAAQVFPALFGLLFVRRLSAVGLIAGLIAGNAAVLVLHFSQANVSGINIGLIALLLNFLVTFAVSAVAKNDSSPAPLATSRRPHERRAERSTA